MGREARHGPGRNWGQTVAFGRGMRRHWRIQVRRMTGPDWHFKKTPRAVRWRLDVRREPGAESELGLQEGDSEAGNERRQKKGCNRMERAEGDSAVGMDLVMRERGGSGRL